MPIYEVTFNRKSKKDSEIDVPVYDAGHYRTIMMEASSDKEALEIANKRLAKQFPEEEGISAQSNYYLQGVREVG